MKVVFRQVDEIGRTKQEYSTREVKGCTRADVCEILRGIGYTPIYCNSDHLWFNYEHNTSATIM